MKQPPTPNEYRDTWCGTLAKQDVDRQVAVAGWVNARRDHGGLIFIDLRDRSGIVQLVVHPGGPAFAVAEAARPEHVLSARGMVVARDADVVNPNIPTGEIEISVTALDHLAVADTPPFPLDEDVEVDEVLRLKHRALDLRRRPMQDAIELRHRVISTMRRLLEERDFLEIETPILTKSTPEGARDYLVPNRREPGTWYALPQSPQLFKQLLMISGFERYYQIARCFRDEDTRADRQPEFTQLDVEMAFVTEEDVMGTMEAVMAPVLGLGDGLDLPEPPWERVPYAEAMSRWGSDRPDRRFGLELHDVSHAVRGAEFKVFASVLEADDGAVLAINAGKLDLARKELDGLNEIAQRHGGKAVAWAYVTSDGWRSSIAKFFTDEQIAAATRAAEGEEGDLLVFAADKRRVAQGVLGGLRLELADAHGLRSDAHDVFWVVDFPAFERTDEGGWTAIHHPFSAPLGDLDGDPGALGSRNYDLICDGTELGGGSIRIHRVDVQEKVFGIIGMDEEEARARFGFLLDALKYGAPPHGGIAFGIDRIVAILGQRDSIRDAIAFPKTASGADPLTGAPAPIDAKQLRELGLRL